MRKIEPEDVVAEMPEIMQQGQEYAFHAVMRLSEAENMTEVIVILSSVFCAGAQKAMQHAENKKEVENIITKVKAHD